MFPKKFCENNRLLYRKHGTENQISVVHMKKDLSRIKITTNLDFRGIQSRHFFALLQKMKKSETKKYKMEKCILKILIK